MGYQTEANMFTITGTLMEIWYIRFDEGLLDSSCLE
jgi:hypothetical protein